MILVTLGTHELPFTRLLKAMEAAKKLIPLEDEVKVQAGHTAYTSDCMQIHTFFSYEEMDQLYEEADILITHAGTGSVITALKKNKVVIAAPRLKKYREHNDDHQLQLVDIFEETGHILTWREGDSLEMKIQEARLFQPKPFNSGKDKLFGLLNDFITGA